MNSPLLLLSLLAILHLGCAFYLPGVAPHEYADGEALEIKAVKLTSVKRPLPYQYYYLPFCRPAKLKSTSENLGEVLRGDRITNTPYVLNMRVNVSCKVVCPQDMSSYNSKQIAKFAKFVTTQYRANWLMDSLPAATKITLDGMERYTSGFPLGFVDKEKNNVFLFNHVTIIGKIHPSAEGWSRVVGFEVKTHSIDASRYEVTPDLGCSIRPKPEEGGMLRLNTDLKEGEKQTVVWSYSVQWEESAVAWASRWDTYLTMDDADIHWFSIVNSLVTVLILSGVLAFIMVRTLRRDIAKYNEEDKEEALEQTGWKLVHGDVFRPPEHSFWLAVCIGTGVQILCVTAATIVFAMLGMLSPASRGSLMTAAIVLYMFFGLVGGYHGARLYKTLRGQAWKSAAMATATLFPAGVFGTGFILNFFVWYRQSSGAVPFTTMIALLLLWFGVSTPLVFVGYYFGFRKQPFEYPVTINHIPRQVPEQLWYMRPVVSVLLAGILPFGAVFIELFFILTAIWENQFYYLFGFLFLVFLILCISCSEIAIVMAYLQLCSEDYHWWWRSFLVSGGCAVYVFAYALFYYATKLEIDDIVASLLYFGYTALMAVFFWFLTGTVGFLATYAFTRKIYGSIKIE